MTLGQLMAGAFFLNSLQIGWSSIPVQTIMENRDVVFFPDECTTFEERLRGSTLTGLAGLEIALLIVPDPLDVAPTNPYYLYDESDDIVRQAKFEQSIDLDFIHLLDKKRRAS
jgi:hypothetical protein